MRALSPVKVCILRFLQGAAMGVLMMTGVTPVMADQPTAEIMGAIAALFTDPGQGNRI
jgi:hypothetical protein